MVRIRLRANDRSSHDSSVGQKGGRPAHSNLTTGRVFSEELAPTRL